jgi:DNA mismatch repair protein MutS2
LYEVDLHGLTVDEAMMKVDRHLHDAYRAGLYEVSIVHGKGTGILRDSIRRYVSSHPLVKSYRRGGYREGGAGVTVIELMPK